MKKNVKKDVTFFQLVQPFYSYFYLCGSWFVLIRNTDQDPQSCRKRIQFRSGSKLPLTVSAVFVKNMTYGPPIINIFIFVLLPMHIFRIYCPALLYIIFYPHTMQSMGGWWARCSTWAGLTTAPLTTPGSLWSLWTRCGRCGTRRPH